MLEMFVLKLLDSEQKLKRNLLLILFNTLVWGLLLDTSFKSWTTADLQCGLSSVKVDTAAYSQLLYEVVHELRSLQSIR